MSESESDNQCFFCEKPAIDYGNKALCPDCFGKAWLCAVEKYNTDNIDEMIDLASKDDEGDAMTVEYTDEGVKFDITFYEVVLDICKYDHYLWENVSTKWIDLSTGDHLEFWDQAKQVMAKRLYMLAYASWGLELPYPVLGSLINKVY